MERILYAGLFRLRADIVPVIESDRAFLLQSEHGIDVNGHRVHRSLDIFVRIFSAQRERVFERHPVRHIPIQRVVRAGLVSENIRNYPTLYDFRKDIRAVTDEADRKRLSISARLIDQFEPFIERVRDFIAVTALQSLLDPRRIDFDSQEKRAVHGRGERLRAAHSAETAGENKFSFE